MSTSWLSSFLAIDNEQKIVFLAYRDACRRKFFVFNFLYSLGWNFAMQSIYIVYLLFESIVGNKGK